MDPFAFLANALEPPWRYWLAGITLVLLVAPRLIELQSSWLDFRFGRRNLDFEMQRLELLKLKYEIEALRKEHDLPDLEGVPSVVPVVPRAPGLSAAPATPPRGEPPSTEAPAVTSPIARFFIAYPAVGKPLLWLLQIGFGFLTAMFAIMVVVVPVSVTGGQDGTFSKWFVFFVIILYGLLAWGSFVAYNRTRRLRRQVDGVP